MEISLLGSRREVVLDFSPCVFSFFVLLLFWLLT